MPTYADILLPLAQPTYTFAVEEGMHLTEGMAVAIPFGRSRERYYTGIVWRLHDTPPNVGRVKRVARVLYGGRRILSERGMRLWEWVAEYYMAELGEVMRIALPAMMKPSSLSERDFEEYEPRRERYVRLSEECRNLEHLNSLLDGMERRAPKLYRALLRVAELTESRPEEWLPRRLLECDSEVLNRLKCKGAIELEEMECSLEQHYCSAFQLPLLTEHQQRALDDIHRGFSNNKTLLLYGVTGSGKTELYIHLIAETLARGEDVLLLVPEITLTSQLVERLKRIFSSRVSTYHSKLTDLRRTESFLKMCSSAGGELVVGARSALFLPFKRLGLIVVDEEHDASYKQVDPAPRYNARDCAVAATRILGCQTILGSATPSLESWVNAHSGKYALAKLEQRYGDATPPSVILSDTLRSAKRGERKSHFNFDLLRRLEATLERGEQAILFQNRRGYAPYVICKECGYTPRCPHCNVSLSWHKGSQRLMCHYCGYTDVVKDSCPKCGKQELQPAGFGTEKAVEELQKLLPTARIRRMDSDSVNSDRAYREAVTSFERGESDILVGTQMVTKGLDFGRVTLVGVLNADNLLLNPDFRSAERAFQQLLQVVGRAGRRSLSAEAVIQSADINHPLLKRVVEGDYPSMAHDESIDRKSYRYPPYSHLIRLTMQHKNRELLYGQAARLADALRERFGRRVLGPVAPLVERIRDLYRVELMLKIESGASMQRAREVLRGVISQLSSDSKFRSITLIKDVDPQ